MKGQHIIAMKRDRRYRDKRKNKYNYTVTATGKIATKHFKAIMAFIQRL